MFRLICGPAGSGKTARAVEIFLAALDGGREPVYVAPSGPDARHFQRRLLKDHRPAMAGGQITTFERVFDSLYPDDGRRAVTPLERLQLLKEAVYRSGPTGVLAASSGFDGFVSRLADLAGELEELGIEPAALGTAMKGWAGGDTWRVGLNRELFGILEEYHGLLDELEAVDPARARRMAALELAADPGRLKWGAVVIDGFWDFTPSQIDFIGSLRRTGVDLTVTLPYGEPRLAYTATGPLQETLSEGAEVEMLTSADAGRDEVLEHICRHLFTAPAPRVAAGAAVTVLEGAAERGQGEMVAAEVLRLWRAGMALDDIAVVTRGYGPDAAALAAAFEEARIPHELAAPAPLASTPVGRTALALLDLLSPEADSQKALSLSLLRGSLAGAAEGTEAEIERLKEASMAGLAPLAAALVDDLRVIFAGSMAAIDLEAVTWDALALKELVVTCEALAALDKGLGGLRTGRTAGGGEGVAPDAAGRLAEAIRQARVRPPAGARRGCVRILDPHRVLNQRFDAVFVCGLLEGRFPAPPAADPFLSDADRTWLRDRAGIALDDHRQRPDKERFLFYRTLTRARKRIYLCYPYCDEKGQAAVASLLVSDVLDLLEEQSVQRRRKGIGEVAFSVTEAPTPEQALLALALADEADAPAGLAERLDRARGKAHSRGGMCISDQAREKFRDREYFTATELEQYIRCPQAFFLERVVKLKPLGEDTFARDRGTAAHEVLRRFFERLRAAGLHLPEVKDEPARIDHVRRMMREIIAEVLGDPAGDLSALVMKRQLESHLNRLITRELDCRPRFRPHQFEWTFGTCAGKIPGAYDEETMLKFGDVKICGRLDRVDLLERDKIINKAVVIDYKSSDSRHGQAKFLEEGSLQLPLYMHALREIWGLDPVGGEYYAVMGRQRRGLYLRDMAADLGRDRDSRELNRNDFVDAATLQERLDQAAEQAVKAAEGIRAAEFPRQPIREDKTCQYCGVIDVCRQPAVRQGAAGGGGKS